MSLFLRLISLIAVAQAVLACGVYEYGVSDKEKEVIINKHNDLRKQVANGQVNGQPRGVNLKRMVWDDYLAGQAQNIANTCIYKHSGVSDSRWSVGQNLYRQPTLKVEKGADWNAAIQYWFDEYPKYKYTPKFQYSQAAGHYTQVVWANTSHIGCGYTYYPDGDLYDKLYVCNYGPAGNLGGATIYEVGDHGCENLC